MAPGRSRDIDTRKGNQGAHTETGTEEPVDIGLETSALRLMLDSWYLRLTF